MANPIPLGAANPLINREVIDVLEEMQCDPIKILAQAAMGDMGADPELRVSAAKELASYLYPKKRSLDMRAHVKAQVTYNVVRFGDVAPEAAKELREAAVAMISDRPRTRAELKVLENKTPERSAVIIEAMRDDIERLVVDEDGMPEV